MFPSVSVGTMAGVVGYVVMAGGAVVAGRTVTHVDTKLAVGTGVAVGRIEKLTLEC